MLDQLLPAILALGGVVLGTGIFWGVIVAGDLFDRRRR